LPKHQAYQTNEAIEGAKALWVIKRKYY
jgi:hypothetical protein